MAADLVLRGGTIVTCDPSHPRARALAIQAGRIQAVSDDDLAGCVGPGTRVVDLAGRAVTPGFVDAHVHFGSFALARQQVDLDQAATLGDGLRLLRSAHADLPPGTWLRGRGWDRNRWGELPTADLLDTVVGARPAALASHDGHALWLSSAALEAVGVRADTPAPPGGVIERDAHGRPTGVLFENAQDLVRDRLPAPAADELATAISAALPLAARLGLTGIHSFEDTRALAAWRSLEAAGELTLRVYHGVARPELADARATGVRTGAGSEWLRVGPLKLFSDGALGSRTAYLLEPYTGRADGYRGVATLEPAEIEADMLAAFQVGLDVAIHAIGDAAVRRVLDCIERVRERAPESAERLVRIEHAQLVDPADVPRFAHLGVVASMQPLHALADWRAADAHWGARARHSYAWRSLLDAGARVAFGTDAPVEDLAPLRSLHAAMTRQDPRTGPRGGWYPEQRLTLEESVRAYTLGSAAAEQALDRRGSIRLGHDADLVVLSADPFAREPAALLEMEVDMTIVGGTVVYEH